MKGAKVNHNAHVNAQPINEDAATIEGMGVWIRKARMFRENSNDRKQEDIRKFGVSREKFVA